MSAATAPMVGEVEMLPSQERVEITSARVYEVVGDPAGQWLHIVNYFDFDGNFDDGSDHPLIQDARARADILSRRFGCPIVDLAADEPRR